MQNESKKVNQSVKKEMMRSKLASTRIPKRFGEAGPEDGKEIKDGDGYWFVGAVGTGKTWQAVATLKKFVLNMQGTGLFVTVPDLLEEIRRGYNDRQQGDFLDRVCSIGLLVLDDLGVEKQTEWVSEKLYQIINGRYNSVLPTIVTSNLSVESIEELLGQRLVSRLLGCCEVVVLEGDDKRLTEKGGE